MTLLTLHGPADVAAALPSLLGFHPEHSLVVIAFRNERVVLTMRVDLPVSVDEGWASDVLRRTQQSVPDAYVFVIADTQFHAADGIGSEVVAALAEASECEVLDSLMVGDGRWRSYLCDGVCCPREGTPIREADVERIRCAMTLTGQALAADRDTIRAEFALGADPIDSNAFLNAVELSREQVQQTLHRLAHTATLSVDAKVLAFTVALNDRHARDAVLWIVTSHSDETNHVLLANLAALMRRTPNTWVGGVGVVAAATAWLLGDGARGVDACERALDAQPDLAMAQMLHAAMAAGMPPSLWREGMRAITLEECWAGELREAG